MVVTSRDVGFHGVVDLLVRERECALMALPAVAYFRRVGVALAAVHTRNGHALVYLIGATQCVLPSQRPGETTSTKVLTDPQGTDPNGESDEPQITDDPAGAAAPRGTIDERYGCRR